MRIPHIQNKLRELSIELKNHELSILADELNRRPALRRKTVSTPMSNDIRQKIIAYHKADPMMPFNRIASALDINPGRVSETLYGKRT